MPRPWFSLACVFAALAVGRPAAGPQSLGSKPPESATKVRKVLVYSYCAGWVHVDGIAAVEDAIAALAGKKGFAHQVVKDRLALTPDFLAGFDVLVWNNNYYAKSSIADSASRQALLDYIRAGGGWVGVHGALDNAEGWTEFGGLLGVSSNTWAQPNGADLAIDGEALSHPELRHMVADFPPRVRLLGELKKWNRSVRGTEGIVVGATLQNPASYEVLTNHDGIAEQALWWARRLGKGRMFMTDVGHFAREYPLADSFAVRALWEHLRYAAGDYRNGCTDPASIHFDPEARVEDGSCADGVPARIPAGAPGVAAALRLDGLVPSRIPLPSGPGAPGAPLTAELHDLRGRRVWARRLDGAGDLDRIHDVTGLEPGAYLLRILEGNRDGKPGKRPYTRRVLAIRRD